ncbi:VWA domain-containing protein [Nocardioides daeguensis]|uniref:VWA domain-containing protein n=1 Tax=Nocardioides daeguensis TaxID=908359 RepID=A0ABP6W5Y0_9ACTN|nr:VWA domain-containing protein [Nocardioides daeguensis]MBV6727778.1 VWA domain-containing protein [Nocardioides daeguensis]MCR1775250.1 VWA domain-containing protein [Nocardioides daeguensis]
MWDTETTTFRWPWLALALGALVLVLLVVWLRPWRRPPRAGTAYVAHTARLQSLPRYRVLVRRQVVLGACLTLASLVACTGAVLLAGRLQQRQTMTQEDRTRDIVLCLDASGSMAEVDAQVLREFRDIIAGLRGERIGLTIWSGAAITVFPLTDDYSYVLEQLNAAEKAFASGDVYSDDYAIFTAGTVLDWDIQSQMGDGLASCVQRFDRSEEDRSRAIVLASDNEPIGTGIFSVPDAAAYAREKKVVVHGIAAPATGERPDAARQFEAAVTSTGGTFSLLGADGSTKAVIDAIADLDAKPIERPPLVQVLDRPQLGTVVVGIGLGGLVLLWVAQGVLVLRDRGAARGGEDSR